MLHLAPRKRDHDCGSNGAREAIRLKHIQLQRVAVLVVNLDDAGQRFTTRLDKPWGTVTPSTGDPFVVRVVNVFGQQLTGRPTEPGWPYAFLWLLLSVGACAAGPGRLLLERFIVERGAVTSDDVVDPRAAVKVERYTFRDGAVLRWWSAPRASPTQQPNWWWPTCRSSRG